MAEGNGEAVTSPQGRAALFAPSPSSARLGEGASERRESNPRSQLGKLMYCLCTTLARPAAWPTMLAPTLSGGYYDASAWRLAFTRILFPPPTQRGRTTAQKGHLLLKLET